MVLGRNDPARKRIGFLASNWKFRKAPERTLVATTSHGVFRVLRRVALLSVDVYLLNSAAVNCPQAP